MASFLPFGLAGTLPAGEARNRNREAHAHPPFDDAAVATSSAGVQTQLGDPFKDQVAACVYEFGNEREGVASVLRVVLRSKLGPVNTYLSASKMSTKWMKPMNITSSFSNRENIRR